MKNIYIIFLPSRRFKKEQHPALMIKMLCFSILVDNLRKHVPHKSIHQLRYKDILNINYVVLT
jgi:hypothetical protein